jgi:hypothetical protein
MFSSTNFDVTIIGERSARKSTSIPHDNKAPNVSAYLLCRILSIIGNVTALVLLPISGTMDHM